MSERKLYKLNDEQWSRVRDEFACAALRGIISKNGFADFDGQALNYSENSYKMADAMLIAREKRG